MIQGSKWQASWLRNTIPYFGWHHIACRYSLHTADRLQVWLTNGLQKWLWTISTVTNVEKTEAFNTFAKGTNETGIRHDRKQEVASKVWGRFGVAHWYTFCKHSKVRERSRLTFLSYSCLFASHFPHCQVIPQRIPIAFVSRFPQAYRILLNSCNVRITLFCILPRSRADTNVFSKTV